MPSFNLVTEPWVPVRTRADRATDERATLVSLEEALLNAREYRRVQHPSPLVTAAVHRLLLAVLHRALDGPERSDDAAEWLTGGFPAARITAYLERWRDRFDLFDERAPFYQVPDLPFGAFTDHWTRLSAERGNGNTSFVFNPALRDRTVDPSDAIPPAEAVARLLEHQTFALGGLMKRFVTSSPAAPVATAALIVARGDDLHETLCLNLVPYPSGEREKDSPVWEREAPRVAQLDGGATAPVRGVTDRYTWLSRSVRFAPEERDGATVVRFMAYAAGVSATGDAAARDPMVALVKDREENLRPLGFREGRGLWRDFHALVPRRVKRGDAAPPPAVLEHAASVEIARSGRFDQPLRTDVFGVANDKAKLKLFRAESFTLPPAILENPDAYGIVKAALEHADRVGQALNGAARALAARLLTTGERSPHKDDVTRLTSTFPHREHYWSNAEREFPAFLAALAGGADAARDAWATTLERTARRAFDLAALNAGDDARALRAIEAARGTLERGLAELRAASPEGVSA